MGIIPVYITTWFDYSILITRRAHLGPFRDIVTLWLFMLPQYVIVLLETYDDVTVMTRKRFWAFLVNFGALISRVFPSNRVVIFSVVKLLKKKHSSCWSFHALSCENGTTMALRGRAWSDTSINDSSPLGCWTVCVCVCLCVCVGGGGGVETYNISGHGLGLLIITRVSEVIMF